MAASLGPPLLRAVVKPRAPRAAHRTPLLSLHLLRIGSDPSPFLSPCSPLFQQGAAGATPQILNARDLPCSAPNRLKGSPPSVDAIWLCPATGPALHRWFSLRRCRRPPFLGENYALSTILWFGPVSLSSPSHGAVGLLQVTSDHYSKVAADQNLPCRSFFSPHRRPTSHVSPCCREFAGRTSRMLLMLSPSNPSHLVGLLAAGACAATLIVCAVTVSVGHRSRVCLGPQSHAAGPLAIGLGQPRIPLWAKAASRFYFPILWNKNKWICRNSSNRIKILVNRIKFRKIQNKFL
jgi:hypothetical protein